MEALDRHAVEWLADRHWPVVTPIMKGLTDIGAHAIVWLVLGAAFALWQRRLLVLVVLALAEEVSSFADGVLKDAIGRVRPPLADPRVHPSIPVPHDPSMPSGHAMMAFTGAVLLAAVMPRLRWPLLVLAAAIGLSRVYLGVHYPSDVVVGAALGAALGAGAVLVLRRGERALAARRH
ncbi:MAG TPA: phosphatase PAP2 family protein [Gaiellales bacterium]